MAGNGPPCSALSAPLVDTPEATPENSPQVSPHSNTVLPKSPKTAEESPKMVAMNGMSETNVKRIPASSSIRPHRCDVCHRSFREVATLRKHEQLHRADRPYICTTCGKSFLWSSNLKVHERVHTGERPYKCKICHRSFTQSNDLRRHERNVHMRSMYKAQGGRPPITAQQMNLSDYQRALSMMQQRALLQNMVYDPRMAYGVNVTSSGLPATPSTINTSPTTTVVDSSPPGMKTSVTPDLKTEQITPPTTPSLRNRHSSAGDKAMSQDGSLYHPTMTSVIHTPISRPPISGLHTNSLPAIATMLATSPITSSGQHTRSPTSPPLLLPQTRLPPAHRSVERSYYDDDNTAEIAVDLRLQKVISMETSTPDGTSGMESESDEKSEESGKGDNSSHPSTPRRSTPSDIEGDEKRNVTTTTASPSRDYGIYHCTHCDVYFRDFTMFHLHQSLHSPDAANPFYCPSCEKHCQDKIEFTFHLVWHVRYPNTIPNYQPFQHSYLMCPS